MAAEVAASSKNISISIHRTLEALKHKSAATLATIAATFCSINIEAHHKSHRKPTDIPQISLFCSMLALIPQSGDFSGAALGVRSVALLQVA